MNFILLLLLLFCYVIITIVYKTCVNCCIGNCILSRYLDMYCNNIRAILNYWQLCSITSSIKDHILIKGAPWLNIIQNIYLVD